MSLDRKAQELGLPTLKEFKNIYSLPINSTIGTSSPRRYAQIKRIRPDIKILPIRGNINTRLDKVKNKEQEENIENEKEEG